LGAAPGFRRLGRIALAAGLGSVLLAVPPAIAASNSARAAAPPASKALGCLIEPGRVAEIGSQVVGVVETMKVERGSMVKAGQPLIILRADVERANADVAQTRARVDADVLAAQASLDMAQAKKLRAESLVLQGFVSEQVAEQARGELEVARQKLNQGQSQQRIWLKEQQLANAQLAQRTLRSPYDGVIAERYVNAGERVEDRPLLRVAVIDPLRVELLVPSAQYGSLAIGDRVSVQPELPGTEAVTATVSHVDRVLDAASNSFRVWLHLPNPDYKLPAGLRCKANLPGNALAPAPAPAPAGKPLGAAKAGAATGPGTRTLAGV